MAPKKRSNVFDSLLAEINMPAEEIVGRSAQTINMPAEEISGRVSRVDMPPEVFAPRKKSRASVVNMPPEEIVGRTETIDMPLEEIVGNPGFTFSDSDIAPLRISNDMMFSDREASKVPIKVGKGMHFTDAEASGVPIDVSKTLRGKYETAKSPMPAEDELLAGYKSKAAGLERDRMAALEQALAEKDLSKDEKVAIALLAALPGLVGAIGGGAIAGGWGAAAGAAGGLQGGAEGVKAVADSKTERRKEAKGEADKLLEQILQQEGLATRRKEVLEGRDIDEKKTKQTMDFQRELTREKEAGDNLRAKEQNRTTLLVERMRAAQRDHELEVQAALARGKDARDPALKQADRDFYSNIDTAMDAITSLESVVNSDGNWESRLGNPDAAAALEQDAYRLAVAYAKIVDPTSVAREGEVEAAKKYMVPMGLAIPNSVTIAALGRLRESLVKQAAARQQLGTPLPESVYAAAGTGPRRTESPEDIAAATKARYGF